MKAVMQAEGLTPTAKNIAAALAVQFANNETGQANPSQETLSDYLKVHRDTIKRALRELRNAGWLIATGDGGRGRAPFMRFLSPGKIVPFLGVKGGANHPAQAEKRGGDLQQKGGQITPPLYNDKQSIEQKGGTIPQTRPAAIEPFMDHRFVGSNVEGPAIVSKDEHGCLNSWAAWLKENRLPALCELPIRQQSGGPRSLKVYFYLPTRLPPTTQRGQTDAVEFFQALIDSGSAHHAAQ